MLFKVGGEEWLLDALKSRNVIGRKTENGKGNMRRSKKMYQLSLPLKHNKILLRDGM